MNNMFVVHCVLCYSFVLCITLCILCYVSFIVLRLVCCVSSIKDCVLLRRCVRYVACMCCVLSCFGMLCACVDYYVVLDMHTHVLS